MERFAGSRTLNVSDERIGVSFPVWVLYPTRVPSSPIMAGPYPIDATRDAPIDDGPFPLVVISHGGGGSHLLYRTFAAHLARHGYVVAMPEHAGNNRNRNELQGTLENLERRPRHIRMAIDAVAADPHLRGHVDANNVALIGHSMGGYTALAVAGGKSCTETGQAVEVQADPRVKALVLLAPATGWFGGSDDSLRAVGVPILMLIAEHDQQTPRWQADLVLARVPDPARVTCEVVENAGHLSFLAPFPPAMRNPGFAPAIDPPGFDRERFHQWLGARLLAFLDGVLRPA